MAGKIDLNKASKEELRRIEGIGEGAADGIVQYREEHGGFKNVEELDNIGGIARTMLDKIKPNVEVRSTGRGERSEED